MKPVIIAVFASLVLAGCARDMGTNVYSRDQAQSVQRVEYGTIIEVQQVEIEGTRSGLGGLGGAIIGGIAGSTIGGGRGSAIAATGGAMAGAVAGSAIEEGATRQAGVQLIVEMQDGRVLSIVQKADVLFREGDSVKVISDRRGNARVIQ